LYSVYMQLVRFGEYLMKHSNRISAENIRDALLEQKRTQKKIGEILVEMGLISSEDLQIYLIDFNINRFAQYLIEQQGMDLAVVHRYANEVKGMTSMEPDYHMLADVLEGNDVITEAEKEHYVKSYIEELKKL
jgi:hypothetical protein